MDDNKDSYMYAPPGPGLLSNNKPSSLLSSNSHALLLRGGSNTAKDVLDQTLNQDKDDSMNFTKVKRKRKAYQTSGPMVAV